MASVGSRTQRCASGISLVSCARDTLHTGGISWGPFILLQGITMLQACLHPEYRRKQLSCNNFNPPLRHDSTRPSQPWGRSCISDQVAITLKVTYQFQGGSLASLLPPSPSLHSLCFANVNRITSGSTSVARISSRVACPWARHPVSAGPRPHDLPHFERGAHQQGMLFPKRHLV